MTSEQNSDIMIQYLFNSVFIRVIIWVFLISCKVKWSDYIEFSRICLRPIEVLDELFAEQQIYFNSLLAEASMSRIRAGIHFKEDTDNGVNVRSAIDENKVNDMRKIPTLQVNSD
jgi:hypothetical protein